MRLSYEDAIELGEALLDAAEIAKEQEHPAAIVRVVDCLVAVVDEESSRHGWKVDPPPDEVDNVRKIA
jgi:hypothetical protein